MIVKINGETISGAAAAPAVYKVESVDPKQVSTMGAKIRKFLPLGHKVVFSLALATAFMDIFFTGGTGSAAVAVMGSGGVSITSAFEPVKVLLLDISDPLCYVMFVWGCIECICGRPASGLNRMKYAAIGYIAINWVPVIMSVIRNAGP